MMPSASDLGYFLEVANTLNLSRAAERLGISQPSLSFAIKRLEESVGVFLLIRHKKGVALTQAGKQLALHAKQLLHYWEKTKSEALASAREVQGYFTLGCNPAIAIYFVSVFLPKLLEDYPKLNIQLKHDISRKITEQVINLSIDIGIVVNPFKHPDLVISKLFEDKVTLWTNGKLRKTQQITSKDSVIICNPELMQAQVILKQLRNENHIPTRILTTNSLEVIAQLTAQGCGIGILPTRVVNALYQNKLQQVPDTPIYNDEICLVYRHENRVVHAFQLLIETIKKHTHKGYK